MALYYEFCTIYFDYLAQEILFFRNRYDYDRFSDFFNWTMTYRSDSDIPAPYGRVVPKSSGFSYMPYAGEERPWEHLYDPSKESHVCLRENF